VRTHKSASLDKLIAIEWETLRDLKRMLSNPELSTGEKTRVANALAYHASVLNKLLGFNSFRLVVLRFLCIFS
jgi:hypothetical protein